MSRFLIGGVFVYAIYNSIAGCYEMLGLAFLLMWLLVICVRKLVGGATRYLRGRRRWKELDARYRPFDPPKTPKHPSWGVAK